MSELFDVILSDELGHDIHSRIWGGVDRRGHNTQPDGEPSGDCYKCRTIRDAIRDALRRFDSSLEDDSSLAEGPSQGLDAAWAEAEAALPEGAFLLLSDDPRYTAEATRVHTKEEGGKWVGGFAYEEEADTPAAALHALAVRLHGRVEDDSPLGHGTPVPEEATLPSGDARVAGL